MEEAPLISQILIVDDEPDVELLIKQKFRKQLKENKFVFFFARNGVEALKILEKTPDIHMVISDINMPEMDGLTLLQNIKEKCHNVIPIIVSAYGDMHNIRAAMNLGAFDFVTKPINFDDLTTTIEKTYKHIQLLMEADKTRTSLDNILHELNVAREIQKSILPHNFIQNEKIEIFAEMEPAKIVGGDFYDFFWLTPQKTRLAFVIADVSGKGVPAALFMTVARTLIRAHACHYMDSPGHCLTQVNRALSNENTNLMFVTAFYGILDIEKNRLLYANAGHNPPYLLKEGEISSLDSSHGLALGISEEADYPEHTLPLTPGLRLFLYTDGVTEAENAEEKLYGNARLLKTLDTHQELAVSELVNTIRSDVNAFAQHHPQSDDITILAIQYK